MKFKFLLIGALALLGAVTTHAQTNTTQVPNLLSNLPPVISVPLDYLSANTNALTATNWTGFAGYSDVSGGKSKYGGTIGAVYYVNPYVGTQIRLQYVNTGKGKWVLPNGTITLQSAYKPIASLPIVLRPLIEAGAAADFNGNLYAVVGAGSELDLFTMTNKTSTIQRISIYYGKEEWQGSANKLNITQYGLAVNLDAEKIITKVSTWVSSAFSKL